MVILSRYGMYGVYVSISSLFIVVRYVWSLPYIRCLQYLMYGTYVCVYIYIALVRMVRTIFAVPVRTGTVRSLRLSSRVCIRYSIHGGTCLIIRTFSIGRCLFLESLIGLLIISILKKYFKFTKQIGLPK